MEPGSNKSHVSDKPENREGLCGMDALKAALCDWRAAIAAFDAAEEPLIMELAAIRMQESGRRYGCLAAQYRQ